MDVITNIAQGFIGWFTTGGETFTGWVTGIIPQVVCLMTFMNSIVKLVGEEKVESGAKKMTKNAILRYSLFPMMADMFLANPMAYTFGRFIDEKYKPAFYDACVSFCHPITGLFPHANAGELFVYMGIAQGLQKAGYELGGLAVRYFIVGLIVITIRGLVTERIYFHLAGIKK
ncbi:PTS glucitol/sorbitol transporter subunit IIC [Catenisphaera adipataccumulans]|jgi:PTS system glucitol/sorbitol-specific IIC component|uniref:PTS system glucitol/sorbitol-specific IIC component n=1 Tax=Catenisphaera adipataccumulans TaxID=700500 RepID=A0A7W8CZ74_9FIRM|nr:PTS glucitol/sorbitol transporter subunit IIC [Catenisphaera adipataccumulans]MBB5183034.1 PTS system glucitol/sorbitol-specific IIC component [Catenisphaera adipataccumulans]